MENTRFWRQLDICPPDKLTFRISVLGAGAIGSAMVLSGHELARREKILEAEDGVSFWGWSGCASQVRSPIPRLPVYLGGPSMSSSVPIILSGPDDTRSNLSGFCRGRPFWLDRPSMSEPQL